MCMLGTITDLPQNCNLTVSGCNKVLQTPGMETGAIPLDCRDPSSV